MGDWCKCPKCGKECIDEWELFSHEHEESISCFTCKDRDTPMLKEPCKNCWNRAKWERRKDYKQG